MADVGVGASLLEDITGTLGISSTGDSGVVAVSYGSALTLNFDKISVKENLSTVDHGGGQSPTEWHRATKGSFEVNCEIKLVPGSGGASLLNKLVIGKQVQLILASSLGTLGETIAGILTDVERDYAGPSTLKFTFKPYGVAGTKS